MAAARHCRLIFFFVQLRLDHSDGKREIVTNRMGTLHTPRCNRMTTGSHPLSPFIAKDATMTAPHFPQGNDQSGLNIFFRGSLEPLLLAFILNRSRQ